MTKNPKVIYLDNAATTVVDARVVSAMKPYFSEKYGNASSVHQKGLETSEALERARLVITESLNAYDGEIIFTSGGTESNNLAIKGLVYSSISKGNDKKHIITTRIEHDCVLNACKWLQTLNQEIRVTYLDVDKEGFINTKELEDAIRPDTLLVSIIHGNNEIGTIQNLEAIGKICRERGIYFHSDACQSFTKRMIDIKKMNIDLLTINSHKIHGPKGVGALYVRNGIKLTPLLHGGGQEKGLRSGTENIAGIVGFAEAVKIAIKDKNKIKEMAKLRDYMIKELLKIPDTKLNGSCGENRLCNNISISFAGVEGESVAAMLNLKRICVSTGSACSSKNLDPSHVIMALENNPERAHGSIRFSLSKHTKKSEIDYTIKEVKKAIEKLRKISPLTHKVKLK
jgi:cysteine desulfurase